MKRLIKLGSAGILTLLAAFTGTAFASQALHAHAIATVGEVAGADASVLELLRPVYDAFAGHQPALGAALGLIALTALTKRYFGNRVPWLHTDAGGSLLALSLAASTAAATGLAVPGATVTFALIKSALLVGVGAAGGYTMIKHLIIEPLLPRLPAWLRTLLTPLLWIFDGSGKPAEVKIAEAIAAGNAAVVASPAQGLVSVVGTPTEIK